MMNPIKDTTLHQRAPIFQGTGGFLLGQALSRLHRIRRVLWAAEDWNRRWCLLWRGVFLEGSYGDFWLFFWGKL